MRVVGRVHLHPREISVPPVHDGVEDIGGSAAVIHHHPGAVADHLEYVRKNGPVLHLVGGIAFERPHIERYACCLKFRDGELYLSFTRILIPCISEIPQFGLRSVHGNGTAVDVHVRIREIEVFVDTLPQPAYYLLGMFADDLQTPVQCPLAHPATYPEFLQDVRVLQPRRTVAHGIVACQAVDAHRRRYLPHRDAPGLESIQKFQNTGYPEIMFDCSDQSVRNGYIVVGRWYICPLFG
ncbi:MAG: hypothetical protein WCS15_10350 [Prevotella sp.]